MDFDLHATPMAAIDSQAGRFGDHDKIRAQSIFIDDVLPAQTVTVFFLDSAGDPERHIVGNAAFLDESAGIDTGSDATFHIAGAAPIQNTVLDIAGMWIPVPERQVTDIDRIDMSVQRDHLWSVTDPPQHIAHRVDSHFVVAELQHFIVNAFDHCAFFRAQ